MTATPEDDARFKTVYYARGVFIDVPVLARSWKSTNWHDNANKDDSACTKNRFENVLAASSTVAVLDSCGCVNKVSNVTPLRIVFNICFTLVWENVVFFYFEIMEKQCRNDLYSDGGSCGFRGFEPKRTLPLLLSSSGTLATSTLLVCRITCDFYHWFVGRGWSTW